MTTSFLHAIKIYEGLLYSRLLSPATIKSYISVLYDFMDFIYASTGKRDICAANYERIITFTSARLAKNAKVTTNTLARKRVVIRNFYSFCEAEGLICPSLNPASCIVIQKVIQRKIPNVLAISEVNAMIDASPDYTIKTLFEVLYATGARVSEAINLKIDDLFLESNYLRINYAKNNSTRISPLYQGVIDSINTYIDTTRRKITPYNRKSAAFLFLQETGRPFTRQRVHDITLQVADKAGITKKVTPHTFRHTYATHLYEGGADMRVIQVLLGHKNISNTEFYVHVSTKNLAEVMAKCHPRF